MIALAWPLCLLLLPLPWLLQRWRVRRAEVQEQEGANMALRVPFYASAQAVLASRKAQQTETGRRWDHWLAMAFWSLLVLALARPQWIGEPITLDENARDVLLAIDISPSMREADMILRDRRVPRILVVKQVVIDFLSARQGDRVGLLLFGAQPYVQAPLTHDLETVSRLLAEARLGMAGNATAIGDTIGLAIKRLKDRPENARVLILLTDGANTGGEVDPLAAARLAADFGIRIHTIGFGTRGSPLYRSRGTELDIPLLTEIASLTGGQFFRAESSAELEFVYEAINQLEPVEQDGRQLRPIDEYFWIPAALAWLLLPLARLQARLASWRLQRAPVQVEKRP